MRKQNRRRRVQGFDKRSGVTEGPSSVAAKVFARLDIAERRHALLVLGHRLYNAPPSIQVMSIL